MSSRAINLNATETEVTDACKSLGVQVSAMENLLPSGTRVVTLNSEGALALRTKFKSKVIAGAVTRLPRFVVNSAMR